QRADVGHDDHRQLLIEELGDHLLRRALVAAPYVGKGRERAVEIERRREQRLRGIGARSGDNADRAAAPALVEELHRTGRTLAGNFQPRDVIAQLDGEVERGFGLALPWSEAEARFADRRAPGVEC